MAWASVASLAWFSSSTALLAMAPLPSLATEATSLPALMAVPPVWLLAPVSVRLPAPVLIRLPVPPMAWASVASVAWFSSRAALLAMAPLPRLATEATSLPALMTVPPE